MTPALSTVHLVMTKPTKYVLPEQTLQEHNLGIQQSKAQFIKQNSQIMHCQNKHYKNTNLEMSRLKHNSFGNDKAHKNSKRV